MRRIVLLLTISLLVGGCTLTDVSTDQEEMVKTETKKKADAQKGLIIIKTKDN